MSIARRACRGWPTDPGAVQLILPVRNIDEVVANAKKAGAEIVSKANGTAGPVEITTAKGKARAVIVRDNDGYLVRAIEVPAADATLPGQVQSGVSLSLAVKDLDETVKFYKEVVGMQLEGDTKFQRGKELAALYGAPANSEFRQVGSAFPNSKARQEFIEWKGMKRTPFQTRVPDPGAGGWVARVNDLGVMHKMMKARNTPMVTPEPIWFSKTTWDIFVSDPDGMHLELFQTVAAPKPTN